MGGIPLFIVVTSIVTAMVLARSPKPKKAIRWLYVTVALFAFVWAMLCLNVYPVYVLPE